MKANNIFLLFLVLNLLTCKKDDSDNLTDTNNDIPVSISFSKDVYIIHREIISGSNQTIERLAKIDLNTGNLDYITSDINFRDGYLQNNGLLYNSNDDTFDGFGYIFHNFNDPPNDFSVYFLKIEQDGTIDIRHKYKNSDLPSDFTSDDMGNYYTLGQQRYTPLRKTLYKINPSNPSLETIHVIPYSDGYSNKLVFNPIDRTFAFLTFDLLPYNKKKPFVMKIYPDGTTNSFYINEEFYPSNFGDFTNLLIDDLGNYYAFHNDEAAKRLVKIDLITGDLEYVTPKRIDFGRNTRGLIYSPTDKAFVGFDYDLDGKPFVIIIDLNGNTNTILIKEEFTTNASFRDLVIK